MSLDSSQALASLIKRITAGVAIDIRPAHGTSFTIQVTYREQSMQAVFDQGGRVPDAVDCISALWARASVISQGEAHFYQTFYRKAYEALTECGEPLEQEQVAHYETWKQNAEDAWRVFGDWFGRRWE